MHDHEAKPAANYTHRGVGADEHQRQIFKSRPKDNLMEQSAIQNKWRKAHDVEAGQSIEEEESPGGSPESDQ